LDSLPPEFRAAVVLCDIEGLSYEEIGATLGVKLGTVRSRIHRGRAALRDHLARHSDACDVFGRLRKCDVVAIYRPAKPQRVNIVVCHHYGVSRAHFSFRDQPRNDFRRKKMRSHA